LTELLKRLGVEDEVASEDACRIEHVISDVTFERLKDYLNQNQK
jgi:Mn-dependent DtxR family transcriptional regulator